MSDLLDIGGEVDVGFGDILIGGFIGDFDGVFVGRCDGESGCFEDEEVGGNLNALAATGVRGEAIV